MAWMTDASKTAKGPQVPVGNTRAIAAMIVASLMYVLSDAAMKFVANVIPTGQAVTLRSAGVVLILSVAASWSGALVTLRQAMRPAMITRSLGDSLNSLCFQSALARMPLADAMAILQLGPLSLTAASAAVLGATVGWRRWCAVAAGLLGALLIIKPGTGAFNVWGMLVVVAVLCGTVRDLSTRRFAPTLSPVVMLLVSQAGVTFLALAQCLRETWIMPSALQFAQIAVGATFIAGGHLASIEAVRHSDLAVVAPFRYTSMLWSLLLGFLIWNHIPDRLSLLGIGILISAGLYAIHRERVNSRALSQIG